MSPPHLLLRRTFLSLAGLVVLRPKAAGAQEADAGILARIEGGTAEQRTKVALAVQKLMTRAASDERLVLAKVRFEISDLLPLDPDPNADWHSPIQLCGYGLRFFSEAETAYLVAHEIGHYQKVKGYEQVAKGERTAKGHEDADRYAFFAVIRAGYPQETGLSFFGHLERMRDPFRSYIAETQNVQRNKRRKIELPPMGRAGGPPRPIRDYWDDRMSMVQRLLEDYLWNHKLPAQAAFYDPDTAPMRFPTPR